MINVKVSFEHLQLENLCAGIINNFFSFESLRKPSKKHLRKRKMLKKNLRIAKEFWSKFDFKLKKHTCKIEWTNLERPDHWVRIKNLLNAKDYVLHQDTYIEKEKSKLWKWFYFYNSVKLAAFWHTNTISKSAKARSLLQSTCQLELSVLSIQCLSSS